MGHRRDVRVPEHRDVDVGDHHEAARGVRDGQQRGTGIHEHLNEQRAADHALRSPIAFQQPMAPRVIGKRSGRLLDGDMAAQSDDQHEAR